MGGSTGNFLIEGYLPGLVMTQAATTARKGPVAVRAALLSARVLSSSPLRTADPVMPVQKDDGQASE
jgi:hypothetical protein